MRRFCRDLRSQIAQGPRVINDGNAAAMRRNDQIVCARMNLQIVHAHRRGIADSHPMCALIERSEQTEVRARIEQLWIYRIFADNFDRVVRRQTFADNALPCLTEIACAQNHRTIVAGAISVRRYVRDLRIFCARLDPHDPLPARGLGKILCQLGPISAVVFRHP